MIGKLRTEESRKEMRKRPGAPSAPAKVTTFCFQPDKGCCKEKTSVRNENQFSRRSNGSEKGFDGFDDYVVHAVEFVGGDNVGREDVDDVAEGAK